MSCDAGKDIRELLDDLRNKSCGCREMAADAIEKLLAENERLRAENDRLQKENFWLSKGE